MKTDDSNLNLLISTKRKIVDDLFSNHANIQSIVLTAVQNIQSVICLVACCQIKHYLNYLLKKLLP